MLEFSYVGVVGIHGFLGLTSFAYLRTLEADVIFHRLPDGVTVTYISRRTQLDFVRRVSFPLFACAKVAELVPRALFSLSLASCNIAGGGGQALLTAF